jgi:8-oxo-dGTP pyrophosphatase MutT (NUDIX family)
MVEEIDHGDLVINQPAGHLEPNESLVEAMMREVLEETSYLTRPEAIVF